MKIWDLPTRIYHWLQALLFVALMGSGFSGNGPHVQLGLALFTLLVWRVLWGIAGSQTSRFRQFIASPKAVMNYLKSGKSASLGHNPAGGWMVVVMLSALLFQCISGMTIAGMLDEMPIVGNLLTEEVFMIVEQLHMIGANLLPGLIAFHVGAVLIYKLKGTPLTWAMVTGVQKQISANTSLYFASNTRALMVLVLAISVTIATVAFA
ncbi:cytochrome b/b6 domain-containing protein [Vibrio sp. SCSIO 43132]|uniref:cytochrome b/b6 domain-containing protein n=1 Tax=Vibrio sp. SCSIO 43132 TaxID=2779363 RepID=UPI001CA8763A|nr:cytochrome b/b6 domain-containing protein [Vibrio sp. SCSIO 43132]UAB73724.1 cytochrome b/b6 domain-containing protein [Vibrio sp. SCSIO 43132]